MCLPSTPMAFFSVYQQEHGCERNRNDLSFQVEKEFPREVGLPFTTALKLPGTFEVKGTLVVYQILLEVENDQKEMLPLSHSRPRLDSMVVK